MQDFTHLDWSESTTSSSTGGSYLKSRSGEGRSATFYKLSCYDEVNGIYGHECVNEIVASRLMSLLCIAHVPYRLVHARVRIHGREHETWLASSSTFRKRGETKLSLARFYARTHLDGEDRLAFCGRFGWIGRIRAAMLVDYLIANRDRHGGNLEVLRTPDGQVHLAPLFDNGLSLYFSTYNARQLSSIDPLEDVVSNNYLGSSSLEENLVRFVPGDLPIGRLREDCESELVGGLEPALEGAVEGVSGEEFASALWRMIWERWQAYENLRDSGRLQAQG